MRIRRTLALFIIAALLACLPSFAEDTEESISRISLNQLGYRPGDEKTVYAEGEGAWGAPFFVVDEEQGDRVFSGVFEEGAFDEACGAFVCRGDFSGLEMEGTYRIEVGEEERSTPSFFIGEDVYDGLYRSVVRMLYLQRCGVATDEDIAGEFAHGPCHTKDAVVYGTKVKKDVSGGWHDAGDYGRYVVSGVKAVADLFYASEMAAGEIDDAGIPESGNGIPDLLDEARFELEWLLKMQDKKSGGVYHKVTCERFPGEVPPEEETAPLILSPISTAATADFAAVMAKAARVYKEIDDNFAEEAFAAAKKAYAYLKTHEAAGFTNPKGISTGEYPDDYVNDECFFAAVELYLSGDESLYDTVLGMSESQLGTGLSWSDVSGYACFDLLESSDERIAEISEKAKETVVLAAEGLLEASRNDGYNVTLGTNYYWGSNMGVANHGMVLLEASFLDTKNSQLYQEAAGKQLDYLLGANSLGYCFVTEGGWASPENPHHRPSQYAGYAVPGMLVGGPDCYLEDTYAKAVLKGLPAAKCYVDNSRSYSTNEVAVYWNSPLIALMAGLM